ncbi:MAG: hypothetical protein HC915_00995 [Anaerolineae bacterium]|nr:hypothetical protein [Anaerolineae bacterium]
MRIYHTLTKLLREFFQEEPDEATTQLKKAIERAEQVPCIERTLVR